MYIFSYYITVRIISLYLPLYSECFLVSAFFKKGANISYAIISQSLTHYLCTIYFEKVNEKNLVCWIGSCQVRLTLLREPKCIILIFKQRCIWLRVYHYNYSNMYNPTAVYTYKIREIQRNWWYLVKVLLIGMTNGFANLKINIQINRFLLAMNSKIRTQ